MTYLQALRAAYEAVQTAQGLIPSDISAYNEDKDILSETLDALESLTASEEAIERRASEEARS